MPQSDLIPGLNAFFQSLDSRSSWDGWGFVSWGDYFDDVARLYPDAVQSGSSLILRGTDTNKLYNITFAFDSNRNLSSVTLSFEGGTETADFAAISRQFTNRLGKPSQSTGTSHTWAKDSSNATASSRPDSGTVLSQII